MAGHAVVRTALLGVVAVAIGCHGDEDEYYPYCHYDCFSYHECRDGVVTTSGGGPIPCEHWGGSCPSHQSYVCERGCRVDTDRMYGPVEPRDICEEWRPKQVGDPCAEERDCEPQVAEVDEEGTVTNVYLRCDTDLGECVARPAPVAPDDYLLECGIRAPYGDPDGWESGVIATDTCAEGVCLFIERETCVEQGCTVRCDSDDDCPMGSTCESFRCLTPEFPPASWGVCFPGWAYRTEVGLPCL